MIKLHIASRAVQVNMTEVKIAMADPSLHLRTHTFELYNWLWLGWVTHTKTLIFIYLYNGFTMDGIALNRILEYREGVIPITIHFLNTAQRDFY